MATAHKLGLRGHFAIPSLLQNAADHYGVAVTRSGDKSYRFDVRGEGEHEGHHHFDIDAFAPSFIEHDGNVFSQTEAKALLDFMNQPFRVLAERRQDRQNSGLSSKEHFKATHEDRVAIHRLLRFATTGNILTQKHDHHHHHHHHDCGHDHVHGESCDHGHDHGGGHDHGREHNHHHSHEHGHDHDHHEHNHHHSHEHEQDHHHGHDHDDDPHHGMDICECHAETAYAMRDMDDWRTITEIGNKNNSKSAIPNSAIDQEKGFRFDLHKNCVEAQGFTGERQEALNTLLWSAINKATGDRYAEREGTIYLSAEELEVFYEEAHDLGLNALISQVEFEETIQQKLDSIAKRCTKLELSAGFKRLSADGRSDAAQRASDLLNMSSALTPVLESETMQGIWTRHNFSKRNESPMASVTKEFAVLATIMDMYSHKQGVTDAEMEAVVQEFYPLLAFSDKVAETLLGALKETQVGGPAEDMLAGVRQNFKDASITNMSVSKEMLEEDYQDIISALEKSLQNGGGAVSQTGEALAEAATNFVMDVANFITKSPKVAGTFAALAATLYVMNGGSSEEAEAVNDTIMLFGENGLEEIPFDQSSLPEEAKTTQNWHWDMGPLGVYKHYMYDNAVVGPAQTIMDWIRVASQAGIEAVGLPINPDPVFSRTAENVADSVGTQLFNVNLFQNATHVAFWMYMASKGYNHGYKGAQKIFDMMSPVTDLGYRAGISGAEKLHLRERMTVSDRIIGLTGHMSAERMMARPETGKYHATLDSLVEAAEVRTDLEETLKEPVQAAEIDLVIGGMKQHFQIGADNFSQTFVALEQFDLVLEHMADQVGIGESWYQHYVRERLHDVTQALRDYKDSGDRDALESSLSDNLQKLVEVQIHHGGSAPLYRALLGQDLDDDVQRKLSRHAKANYAALKRANSIEAHQQKIGDTDHPLTLTDHLKARASIWGTKLWGGIVGATRKAREVAPKIANKTTMIGAAGLSAACVALDMANGGNYFTDAISSGVGATVSTAVTTTIFTVYNFWEDVLGVHVGSGLAMLSAGAAAGYAYKGLIRPTAMSGFEHLNDNAHIDLPGAWDDATHELGKRTESIRRKLRMFNEKSGEYLSGSNGVQEHNGHHSCGHHNCGHDHDHDDGHDHGHDHHRDLHHDHEGYDDVADEELGDDDHEHHEHPSSGL